MKGNPSHVLRYSARAAVASVASAALAVALVPAAAFAQDAPAGSLPEPTARQVEQLLDGQEYVEGEAIVVAEAGARLDGGDAEQLASAGDEALELTADAALASDEPAVAVAAQRAEASDAGSYEVSIVKSNDKTTAQLIEELYENPQVVSAEPNYITRPAEADAAAVTQAGGAGNNAGGTHNHAGDLTAQQWYMDNDGTYSTPQGTAVEGVDMGIPGWKEHRTDGSADGAVNSSGTIAIVDSGMDVTHPDLEGVLYSFSPEQQEKYDCGEHGLNASLAPADKDYATRYADVSDPAYHGTHVSGVAGAAWNGEGVSGVANGAKLFCVRVSNDDGGQSNEYGVRAFDFLIKCAKDVNLKSVNCSWSGPAVEFTYTLLVNQLGSLGAVTVFASGNENTNVGEVVDTASFIDSPYLLSVDAHNSAGTRSGFSNYSSTSTDVFAPGSQVLSTVPGVVRDADGNVRALYNHFLPTSAGEAGVLGVEKFAEGTAAEVFAGDPSAGSAKAVGAVTDEAGFDDGSCWRIPVSAAGDVAAPSADGDEDDVVHSGYSSRVFVAVPVSDPNADVSYVSARFSADKFSMDQAEAGLFGIVATTKDGKTKLVDMSRDSSGRFSSSDARAGFFSWGDSTLDVAALIEADADATGVYHDAQGRIVVEAGLTLEDNYDALYLDNFAVGGADAKTGSYKDLNGTSMAAPAVAGALAVIAKDEPANADADDPGQMALERVARLRAATVQSDALENYCSTGGYVNLSAYKSLPKSTDGALAPIITSAAVSSAAEGRTIRAEGHFFGASQGAGAVSVDGAPVAVTSWSDTALVAELPSGIANGAHVLKVATADGADKYAFSTSYESGQLSLFERELALPDLQNAGVDLEKGVGGLAGGFAAHQGSLYTLQTAPGAEAVCLWRYKIAEDTWEPCGALPTGNFTPYGNILAPTSAGLVMYVSYSEEVALDGDDPELVIHRELYDYDVASATWTKREIGYTPPDFANIFTIGDDVCFVGGRLEGSDKAVRLSVNRAGTDTLEVLGTSAEHYSAPIEPAAIAVTDGSIYLSGIRGNGLTRLSVGSGMRVASEADLAQALFDAGIAPMRVQNPIALAATPDAVFAFGRTGEGTDVHRLADGSDAFAACDFTSSFFKCDNFMTTWHDGVLYTVGFTPGEPTRMYFRAQGVAAQVQEKANYRIEHLLEKGHTGTYELDGEAEVWSGVVGAQTVAVPKTYEGFVAQPVAQETIDADDSTVVQIRYSRQIDIKGAKATKTTATWTGKKVKVTPKLTLNGKTLKAGTDYEAASYSTTKPGAKTLTFAGKGLYSGTLKVKCKVVCAKAKVKTVKPAKRKLKLTWGKTGASKYTVKYRVKGAKTWQTKTVKKTKATLGKLKSGKRYQVRVDSWAKGAGTTTGKVKLAKKVK